MHGNNIAILVLSSEVFLWRERVQEWRPEQWLRPVPKPQLLPRMWTWFDTRVKVCRLAQMPPTRVLHFSLTNPFMISQCDCTKPADHLVYDWVDTCSLWFSMLSWLLAIGVDYFYTKPIYCVLDLQLWCVFALSSCKSDSLISRLIISIPTDELWPFNDDQNLTERAIILRIKIHLKLTPARSTYRAT